MFLARTSQVQGHLHDVHSPAMSGARTVASTSLPWTVYLLSKPCLVSRLSICMPQGYLCDVPTTCYGVVDGNRACCEYELARDGTCCKALDSQQLCCSGVVDAAGVCNGSAESVDLEGSACKVCMPSVCMNTVLASSFTSTCQGQHLLPSP